MRSSPKDLTRQVANALIIPIAIAVSFWPRRGGHDIGDIARQSEPLLTAAGWAFSIWGLIFAGQLAYAVYQALPSQRANPVLRRVGEFTALACLGGGLWTAFFTAEMFAAAWVTMLLTLGALIAVEVQLGNAARHGRELWLIRLPFALNLGWVSVATILNSAHFFSNSWGWNGEPATPLFWALLMTGVATTLGVVMAVFRRNLAYAAAVAWGLAGIAAEKRFDEPSLSALAAVGAVLLSGLVVGEGVAMWRGRLSVDVGTPHGV